MKATTKWLSMYISASFEIPCGFLGEKWRTLVVVVFPSHKKKMTFVCDERSKKVICVRHHVFYHSLLLGIYHNGTWLRLINHSLASSWWDAMAKSRFPSLTVKWVFSSHFCHRTSMMFWRPSTFSKCKVFIKMSVSQEIRRVEKSIWRQVEFKNNEFIMDG